MQTQTIRQYNATTKIVDDGISLLDADGRYKAAHFMLEHGIRFRVIVRVLAPSARRREASAPPSG